MKSGNCIEVENIDHLGLVAGIIDEIGLVEQINELLGQHPQEKVSGGHAVKAMILNGLGFVSGALYMFPEYFKGKACEHLIGEGVKAEYLNDDRLGRVMDKLYVKGLNQVFTNVAISAAKKYKVAMNSSHLDSTSLHLHGKYETETPSVIFEKQVEGETIENVAQQPINISYGYSRDHRPDLKQFILELICSSDGDVP
jgi:transposase